MVWRNPSWHRLLPSLKCPCRTATRSREPQTKSVYYLARLSYHPVMARETFTIEGAGAISLTAEAEGDAYAIPVLLAHGGGQTRRAWRRVVSELLKPAFAQSPSTWAVTE